MTTTTEHPMTTPASILAALARIEADRATILARSADAADAETIAAQFPELLVEQPWVAGCCAYLTIVVDRLDQAAPVLRAISALGYRCGERSDRVNEQDVCVWRPRHPDGRMLYVSVTFSGSACRFVQVGEKVVPEYAIQCGDA